MWFSQCTVSEIAPDPQDGVTPFTCDTQASDEKQHGGSTGAPAWEYIAGVPSIRGINTILHIVDGALRNVLMTIETQDVNSLITWATSESGAWVGAGAISLDR